MEWMEILIIFTFVFIGLTIITFVIINYLEVKEDLEICKELGYDGIKFTNRFSNEVECSNFTELEKAKNERREARKK